MSTETKSDQVLRAVIPPRGLRPQGQLARSRHEDEETMSVDHLSDAAPVASGSAHDFGQIRVHPDQDDSSRAARQIQAKLTIGQADDRYEQAADRVAHQVMRMPEPRVQRQVSSEEHGEKRVLWAEPLANQITPLLKGRIKPEDEEDETIQTKLVRRPRPQVGPALATQIHSLKGQGQPLPASERAFFEPRFGHDFSSVRVHTDAQAAELARAVNARALTFGDNIAFGTGEFTPETKSGKWIIAHELAHVIQQGGGVNVGGAIQRQLYKGPFSPPLREPPKAGLLPGREGGIEAPARILRDTYGDIPELVDVAMGLLAHDLGAKFVLKFKKTIAKAIPTRWGKVDVNVEGALAKGEISAPKGQEMAKVEMSQEARVKFRESLSNIFGLEISDIEAHQEVGPGMFALGARIREKYKLLEGEGLTDWSVAFVPEFAVELKYEAKEGFRPLVFKARFEGTRHYEYGSGHVFKAGWEIDVVFKYLPNPAAIARDIARVTRATGRLAVATGGKIARGGRLALAGAEAFSVAATGAEASGLGTLAAVAEAGGLLTIMISVPIASYIELTYGKKKKTKWALEVGYRNRAFSYRLAQSVFKESRNLEAFEELLSDSEGGMYAAHGVLAAEVLLLDASKEQREQLKETYEGEKGFTHFWDELTRVMRARQLGGPDQLPTSVKEIIDWNSSRASR